MQLLKILHYLTDENCDIVSSTVDCMFGILKHQSNTDQIPFRNNVMNDDESFS